MRHNSNNHGNNYGVCIKDGDLIEILVDMIDGNIQFIINNINYGIAFKDD